MNILFFTKGDRTTGSSRQRVWNVADRLREEYNIQSDVLYGITYSFWSLSSNRIRLLKNIIDKLKILNHGVIIVHKSLFPWDVVILIVLAKILFKKKLIYDLDDAEWIHSPRKSIFFAKYADKIFCGSHEILRWAQEISSNCMLVPTVVDVETYARYTGDYREKNLYTIGWVGYGRAHFKQGNFHIIKDALNILHKKGIAFTFIIVVSEYYQPLKKFFHDVPYEVIYIDEVDWKNSEIVPQTINMYKFDLGVMPLRDTSFNRAKCAFKAIEYMACGVPVVASTVGESEYVVQDGEVGFLVKTPEEWAEKIFLLLSSVSLRNRLGKNGQIWAQKKYSYTAIIPEIRNIFLSICK